MFNKNALTSWIPYKIPATPDIEDDGFYSLSCSTGSDSLKNPSQFLYWQESKDFNVCENGNPVVYKILAKKIE